jgi:hypothetical protein
MSNLLKTQTKQHKIIAENVTSFFLKAITKLDEVCNPVPNFSAMSELNN